MSNAWLQNVQNWLLRKGKVTRWLKIAESSSKFLFIFSLCDKYILHALYNQSLAFSRVMSVKSAIFKSLFTTCQKINIAVFRSLIHFYSNIWALTMLSRCLLKLSMGVFPQNKNLRLFMFSINKLLVWLLFWQYLTRGVWHLSQCSIRPSIYFSLIVKSRSYPFLESTSTK